jgi:hypothetical protein
MDAKTYEKVQAQNRAGGGINSPEWYRKGLNQRAAAANSRFSQNYNAGLLTGLKWGVAPEQAEIEAAQAAIDNEIAAEHGIDLDDPKTAGEYYADRHAERVRRQASAPPGAIVL